MELTGDSMELKPINTRKLRRRGNVPTDARYDIEYRYFPGWGGGGFFDFEETPAPKNIILYIYLFKITCNTCPTVQVPIYIPVVPILVFTLEKISKEETYSTGTIFTICVNY